MSQRILVPLDGSSRAERAIPVAARLARASGGSLILLRVVPSFGQPAPATGAPTSPPANEGGERAAEANAYLAAISAREDVASLPTETLVLAGSPAPLIRRVARSANANQIVLCSHGRTGLTRWALGSVADKVVRSSPVPVLVLKEGGSDPLATAVGPNAAPSVLVPLDGSPLAESALDFASQFLTALAGPVGGRLHLVHVLRAPIAPGQRDPAEYMDDGPRARSADQAREYVRRLADRLRTGTAGGAARTVSWSLAFGDDVAATIIRIAEEGQPGDGGEPSGPSNAIALSTHGLSGLQHWVMGSIAERVLHGTRLPVLVVHPPSAATAAEEEIATEPPAEPWMMPLF